MFPAPWQCFLAAAASARGEQGGGGVRPGSSRLGFYYCFPPSLGGRRRWRVRARRDPLPGCTPERGRGEEGAGGDKGACSRETVEQGEAETTRKGGTGRGARA